MGMRSVAGGSNISFGAKKTVRNKFNYDDRVTFALPLGVPWTSL